MLSSILGENREHQPSLMAQAGSKLGTEDENGGGGGRGGGGKEKGKKKEKEEKEFHARRHYFMSDPTKNYSNYILLLGERIETRGERQGELIMDVY